MSGSLSSLPGPARNNIISNSSSIHPTTTPSASSMDAFLMNTKTNRSSNVQTNSSSATNLKQTILNKTDIKFRIQKQPISQHDSQIDGISANTSELGSPKKISNSSLVLKLPNAIQQTQPRIDKMSITTSNVSGKLLKPSDELLKVQKKRDSLHSADSAFLIAAENPNINESALRIDQNNQQIHQLMSINKHNSLSNITNGAVNVSIPLNSSQPRVKQLQILPKESLLPQTIIPSPLVEDSSKQLLRKNATGIPSLSLQTQPIQRRNTSKDSPDQNTKLNGLKNTQKQQQIHSNLPLTNSEVLLARPSQYFQSAQLLPLQTLQQSQPKRNPPNPLDSLTSRTERKDLFKEKNEFHLGHPPKTAGLSASSRNNTSMRQTTTFNQLPENSAYQEQLSQQQQCRLKMNYRLEGAKAKKSYSDLQDIMQLEKTRAVRSSHNTYKVLDIPVAKEQQQPKITSNAVTSLFMHVPSWAESIQRMSNPFMIAGCEDIEEQLRKELSNLNTDVPSSRMEVITLQKWFDSSMNSHDQTDNSDELSIFKHINICLSELLRQISLDCFERGTLLKAVTTKLSEQSMKLVGKIRDDFLLEKQNLVKEAAETKNFYEKLYEKKDIEILELNHLNEETNNKFSKENSIVDKLYAKEKEMNAQVNHLRQISTFLQTQLKAQSKDNLKLRIKLKKKLDIEEKILERIEGNMGGQISVSTKDIMGQEISSMIFQGKQPAKQIVLQQTQQKQSSQPQYSNNQIKKDLQTQLQLQGGTNFNNSLSESEINDDPDLIAEKTNFSLSQPYILKHTANNPNNPQSANQLIAHGSSGNSQELHKSSSQLSRQLSGKSSSKSQMNKSEIASPHAQDKSIGSGKSQEKQLIHNIFDKLDNIPLKNAPQIGQISTKQKQSNQDKQQQQSKTIHMSESSKKVLEIAIQEQKEESEISSVSSEDSKLIIDEAQNDMMNIEQLNAVGYLDPDTAIRRECAETQVNDSLLAMTHSTMETQTALGGIVDDKYDEFLHNNAELDYLIEFRINGLNNLKIAYDSSSQQGSQNVITSERSIKSRPSVMLIGKPLNNPLELYKGKFNRFEQMYEEGQTVISELEEKLSDCITKFNEREESLLTELAETKAKLKEEIEQEQRRIKELNDKEQQRKLDEAEAEKQRKLEMKKSQEIPEKWRNYQSTNKKMGIELTKGSNAPKLGQRQAIDFEQKYQTDAGQQIVEKLQNKKYQKFKNFMPLSTLLKQINLIYQDRVKLVTENPRFREITCTNFSYIFLTKLFGLKKIVDQKFVIFVLSLKKYAQIFRVNMFSRFFNLIEQKGMNYTLDEFNKYIEALDFIQNQCQIGKDLEASESETKYFVPYLKVASFVGNFADARMTSEETSEFKKEIDQLKEIDPRYPTVPVVDLDAFVSRMLSKYKMLVNRAKTYVINAFDSSDLDGNGVCNLEEFLILNRNIEADNYNEEILTNIFNDNADVITDGEPTLTFDKFAAVCVDFNIFTEEAQDAFIGIRHKREIDMRFEELKTQWPIKQREYESRVNGLKYTELDVKEKWKEIIEVLHDKINSKEKQEVKPLLIAEKILDKELDFLEIFEQEGFEDEEALNEYIDQENVQMKVKNFNENIQNQVKEKMKLTLKKNHNSAESPMDSSKANIKPNP